MRDSASSRHLSVIYINARRVTHERVVSRRFVKRNTLSTSATRHSVLAYPGLSGLDRCKGDLMAFCTNCGADVTGKSFCVSCGKPVGSGQAATPPQPQPGASAPAAPMPPAQPAYAAPPPPGPPGAPIPKKGVS